jgi:lipopolysaccharide export LptBFGC system permease protein LptF
MDWQVAFTGLWIMPVVVSFLAFVWGEFSRRAQTAGMVAIVAIMAGLFARLAGESVQSSTLLAVLSLVVLNTPSWFVRYIRSFS